MGKLARVSGGLSADSIFDGLAGGAAVSRIVAEFSREGVEERVCGLVDGFDAVRAFAHYEFGISELALCDSGGDCGAVLWVDVEEDGVDFCFSAGACGGGCYVAFFVSDVVSVMEKIEGSDRSKDRPLQIQDNPRGRGEPRPTEKEC